MLSSQPAALYVYTEARTWVKEPRYAAVRARVRTMYAENVIRNYVLVKYK